MDKKTLLVVDDQPLARRLVHHALRERYHVVEAQDSATVFGVIATGRVDLILLDLHLPPHLESPCEGLEIYSRVREQSPDLPVVIVSSNNDPQLRGMLLRRGARSFLKKPYQVDELAEVVREALGE